MASRLTELGPRIHAFPTVDAALDELSTVHGDPDLIPFPPTSQPADLLPSRPETDTSSLGRVLPLRPQAAALTARRRGAAETFDDGPAAA